MSRLRNLTDAFILRDLLKCGREEQSEDAINTGVELQKQDHKKITDCRGEL